MSTTETFWALADICRALQQQNRCFALVGGLAMAIRAEIRFTRDVHLVVTVAEDGDAESLVFALGQTGYQPLASVEHESQKRLATMRLRSRRGIAVDLLFASSGIEPEIVQQAEIFVLPDVVPSPWPARGAARDESPLDDAKAPVGPRGCA